MICRPLVEANQIVVDFSILGIFSGVISQSELLEQGILLLFDSAAFFFCVGSPFFIPLFS